MGLTAVACSNLFMGGPAVGGGTAPVPQADPSEVLLGVGLTILSQLIGERLGSFPGLPGPLMSRVWHTSPRTSYDACMHRCLLVWRMAFSKAIAVCPAHGRMHPYAVTGRLSRIHIINE